MLAVEVKVEKQSYGKAIEWLRDIVWGTKFDVERLRIGAAKLAQSLPEQKRDGRTVSRWTSTDASPSSTDPSFFASLNRSHGLSLSSSAWILLFRPISPTPPVFGRKHSSPRGSFGEES